MLGIIDVIFGLGVTLANAGVIERKALAANMERILQQQTTQGGQNLVSRQLAARILQGLFSAELLSGLRVIDGNKDPEGGPDAA